MNILRSAILMSAVCCTALVADLHAANAASLLDYLTGRAKQSDDPSVTVVNTGNGAASAGQNMLADDLADPLPRVKSPTYNTYKPEAFRVINLSKVGDLTNIQGAMSTSGANATDTATTQPVSSMKPADLKIRTTDAIATALETYYAASKAPIWVTDGAANEKAKAAMDVLAKANLIGLEAADYLVAAPDLAGVTDEAGKRQALAAFELKFSSAVLSYILDNVRGRVEANKLSGYHDFDRKSVNLIGVLKVIAASPSVAAYLSSRTPDSSHFQALVAELARLRALPEAQAAAITIAPGTYLKPGSSSSELPNVIAAIQAKASDKLKVDHAAELTAYTGGLDYTPDLVNVVKAFQSENGLKPDGVIGKSSIRVMTGGDKTGDKINKVIVALEQARWLPNDLGSRRVFINEPEFMVHYWNNNAEQFSMRVVVGGKNTQTYFFQDQIETVEFNPYWGVPHSIIVNEMLPKLRQNPGYLDQLGYEVSIKGQAVSSSTINWYQTNDVDVRQPPGRGNALGELKILFPNSHSIYMHDTPQKSFFTKDMRALSHGCVRLVDPRKMAAAVLGITEADVAKQIASGQNKQVSVPQKIPVYVAYFTAWPNKDGVVEYFDDVYDRDMYTNRAFDAIRASRKSASSGA